MHFRLQADNLGIVRSFLCVGRRPAWLVAKYPEKRLLIGYGVYPVTVIGPIWVLGMDERVQYCPAYSENPFQLEPKEITLPALARRQAE